MIAFSIVFLFNSKADAAVDNYQMQYWYKAGALHILQTVLF